MTNRGPSSRSLMYGDRQCWSIYLILPSFYTLYSLLMILTSSLTIKILTALANTVHNELKHELKHVSANKLTLHPDKTKYIIFHPSWKKMDLTNCKIKMNNTTISRVQSTQFRGVIIHKNLSWKPHIETICSKTSKVIGLICKARQYLLYIQTP